MNSYEFLRPDGTRSGLWACGKCHRAHLVAEKAHKPVSDFNQKSAEECCVPRCCIYCGKPTKDDYRGSFPRVHYGCLPKHKYEPPPPHPSMTNPFARLLHQKMSEISERCQCAVWIEGNEYTLWNVLQMGRLDYSDDLISDDDLEELRVLSEQARGWIWVGPDGEYVPQLVTFEEWQPIFAHSMDRRAVHPASELEPGRDDPR